MRTLLLAAVLALSAAAASVQTASETTQATVPPLGTLATTRETHTVDASGNRVESQATSFRNAAGVTRDSTVATTRVPPPPRVASTLSSSTTTTMGVPN